MTHDVFNITTHVRFEPNTASCVSLHVCADRRETLDTAVFENAGPEQVFLIPHNWRGLIVHEFCEMVPRR